MAKAVTVRKIGNSLGVTISEHIRDMGLGEGDRLFAVRTANGIELTPYDPDFAEAVEEARKFMRVYPNAMKALAE